MLSKNETIKASVDVSEGASAPGRFDQSNRDSFLRRAIRALSKIVSKRVGAGEIREIFELISVPASFLFFLSVPISLVCISGASLVVLWWALLFNSASVAFGVLLFMHRSKKYKG